MPNREEVRVETNGEDVTLGLDAGSVSASISSNGDLTLGIGIAEVEINLKDPNDATLSFGFGLYTIDGERQGCTVILRYYIAGQLAMTETRVIPECDEPEPTPEPTPEPEPEPEPEPDPNDDFPLPPSPKVPNPYQRYKVLIHQNKFEYSDAIVSGDTVSAHIVNPQATQEGESYTYSVKAKGSAWYYSLNGRIVYGEKHSFSQSSPFWEVDDARVFWPTSWITDFPSFYGDIGIVGVFGLGLDINNLCSTVFASYVKKTVFPWVHNYLSGYYDAETEMWIVTGPFRQGAQDWGVFQKSFNIEIIEESSYPPILKHPPPYKDKEEKMDDNCCEMIEEIYEVLAVNKMLKPLKISGNILKEIGEGIKIDEILENPDLEIEINNYMTLNTFLSLLSNKKVARAVGVDELEFEKDEKNPIFHYLRWLKEYNEKLTALDYEEWLTTKKKEEGLKASKTQFQSIPQLMLAELYNSKNTNRVLRTEDILKTGMEIPNELYVPGGLGFTSVYDYPNIFKKIIQILDLSTIQPFTAILQDSNPSQEGDQTLTKYYPDATSAVKEIVELLLENKVDSATRLNIAIRQSILNAQQQVALLETLSIAYTILYGLGLPFHQKGSYFIAPFDISPKTDGTTDKDKKGGKGFNPKNQKEDEKVDSAINALNEGSESATEKLLPDFLKTVKQEYLHSYFDDKKNSLWYYVMSVFMKY